MDAKPRHDPPHGMEPYDLGEKDTGDLGALSAQQQQMLNNVKIKTRIDNELYLRQHPEIDCLISSFIGEVLRQRPDNIREYAAGFFTDPELPKTLEKLMEERQQLLRMNDIIRQL